MNISTRMLARMTTDRRGILVPALLLIAGGTVDFAQIMLQRQRLQDAVDAATLAATRELGLADSRRENVASVVETMVKTAVSANGFGSRMPNLTTVISSDPLEIRVDARLTPTTYFGGGFGLLPSEIQVASVARIVGRPNVCLLGLDPSATGTISLEKEALVTAQNCAVFSNSTANNGLKSKNSSTLSASLICTAGGKDGGKGNFSPEPLTDCPTFDDPLASRPEPPIAACDPSLPKIVSGSIELRPGTYCGGLRIKPFASVTLQPGIYVIKDGELLVDDDAKLAGKGVGFFLVGDKTTITFKRRSSIDLSASTTGPLAGMLMFEARIQSKTGRHQILSDDARNLLGTIYLSRGELYIDANKPIADRSAYTAIVARQVTLYGGPNLVLNANYDATDVPVPDGIRGVAQPAKLVK